LFLFLSTIMSLAAQVGGPSLPASAQSIQIVSGNNQSAVVNTGFAQPMTVRVVDANGIAVPGVTVTFTFPTPPTFLEATGRFVSAGGNTFVVTTNGLGFATSNSFVANPWVGGYPVAVSFSRVGGGTVNGTFNQFNEPIPAPNVLPTALTFSMVIGDKAPATQTVTVVSPTNGYDATADSPWVKLTLRTNIFLDVSVDPAGLAAGRYFSNITVNGKAVIPVQFTINPKPFLSATLQRINFGYVQGNGEVPLSQFFSVASSVRNVNLQITVKYNNPATGNWLFGASSVGMTTPVQLQAVCDPRGMGPGAYQAELNISSPDATNSPLVIPVTMVIGKYPYFAAEVSSVLNAASFEVGAISAGELVRISGANLACATGVGVFMDGEAATILSTGSKEIGALVPASLSGRNRVDVRVGCGSVRSDPFSIPVSYAAPGLFTVERSRVLAFNEDRTLNGRGTPASRGSIVALYGTGIGDGVTAPISVNIGGQAATLLSASPVAEMPGVVRLQVRVPFNAPIGDAAVEILAGFEGAQTGPTLAVQ
jgi:uncharacterized protein (TIGR03437 family)